MAPGGTAAYLALECNIPGSFKSTRETGTVEMWKNRCFGGARRPCGCSIFIKTENNAPENLLDLKPGDAVEFNTVWSRFKHKWVGVDVCTLEKHQR
jgi:hypothetical protein